MLGLEGMQLPPTGLEVDVLLELEGSWPPSDAKGLPTADGDGLAGGNGAAASYAPGGPAPGWRYLMEGEPDPKPGQTPPKGEPATAQVSSLKEFESQAPAKCACSDVSQSPTMQGDGTPWALPFQVHTQPRRFKGTLRQARANVNSANVGLHDCLALGRLLPGLKRLGMRRVGPATLALCVSTQPKPQVGAVMTERIWAAHESVAHQFSNQTFRPLVNDLYVQLECSQGSSSHPQFNTPMYSCESACEPEALQAGFPSHPHVPSLCPAPPGACSPVVTGGPGAA